MISLSEGSFEPRIVVIACHWCTYQAINLAGTSRFKYPPNVRVIRVMCSGRSDPQFVIEAFRNGADGVLVAGCHPGDCHYVNGNMKTMRRTVLLEKMLEQMGIEKERFRREWISAAEAKKWVDVVTEMVEQVRKLGPLRLDSGR
ncbi:MAG: hydrogenase iron-sulfur subunit [Candidatus Korarchaeum sp.]